MSTEDGERSGRPKELSDPPWSPAQVDVNQSHLYPMERPWRRRPPPIKSCVSSTGRLSPPRLLPGWSREILYDQE
ncbi:hypothetical protein GWI33_005381 [Rhynchophorus ferrugineus]|uniref:Uncharacterized protein n=1 Tax=Rhynchophorus ferrugineus TaxID=354439 RepID=A0A834INA5_RHYFE|nr:hypothetical protein GWI33_005381 [Rhynchophorus ferrugineus]